METLAERAKNATKGIATTDIRWQILRNIYIDGAISQNKIIRNRLTEMQGEYITLELINELFDDEQY